MTKLPMDFSEKFAIELSDKFNQESLAEFTKQDSVVTYHVFEVEGGVKFDRITHNSVTLLSREYTAEYVGKSLIDYIDAKLAQRRNGGSVHAFVERRTGKLVKPAGYKQPAKLSNGELQSKFELLSPSGFAKALASADWAGGYLYLR